MSALDELFEKVGEHKDGDKRVVHIFSTFEKFDEAIEELAQLRAKLVAAEKLAERVKRYTITPGDDGFDLCEFVTAFEKAEENLKTELSEIAFATHATNIFNLRKEGER